jgi:hypothetical protein
MAPERMLYWCMASAPVMCCQGKEIVGDVVMGFYDVAALGSLLCTLLFWTALVNSGRLVSTPHPAGWPPIIKWLWRIPWMLWLLAAISFVVLRLRYPVGGDITISPNVPLMESVLQVLALGGIVGGYIIFLAWRPALLIHAVRSRGHERNAAARWQQLWQPHGHVVWDIVLLIMVLVWAASGVFLIYLLVMIINLFYSF